MMVNELIDSGQLALFLAGVFVISISGALMPGPVSAAALFKGRESGASGISIAIGHALIEIPLIAAISLGISRIFRAALENIRRRRGRHRARMDGLRHDQRPHGVG